MPLQSLRELIVLFDTQLQQLTITNLATGFFPMHSLVSSFAATVICGSLATATRASSSSSSSSSPALFSSFTSFSAICVLALMTTTLLFRLTGGRFVYTARSTGDVVDWLMDAISRPLAEDTAKILLSPDKRRERVIFFVGLCFVGEVGKLLSFWSMLTLVSLVWLCWSIRKVYMQHIKE